MSILIKLAALFFLMDTFIRKPFHLERLLDVAGSTAILRPAIEVGYHGIKCPGHEAWVVAPYCGILFLYGIAVIVLSVALMIYESRAK